MQINIDTSDMIKAWQFLGKNVHRRICMRVLNRVGNQAATRTKREVTQRYNIAQKNIKIKKVKANPHRLIYFLFADSRPTNLMHFKPRHLKKKGIKVSIIKGRVKYISSGFIRTVRSGSTLALKRKTKQRYPLKKLTGPSPQNMIRKTNIKTEDYIQERLPIVFNQYLKFEADKYLKKQLRKKSA